MDAISCKGEAWLLLERTAGFGKDRDDDEEEEEEEEDAEDDDA
jgi:hypothetical protein